MSEAPRMVIVPAKATFQMTGAGKQMLAQETAVHPFADPIAWQNIYRVMCVTSPNAGKVSRADLERAMEAADHAHASSPGPADQLNRIWQDAFAAALGLKIAEDQKNG